MSTAIPSSPAKSKSKKVKEKEKDRDHERKQLPGERLKIVVRRLPPNLPEDIFWQSVSNWVTDDTVMWKLYFPGKPKKRMNKENIPSRAYIAFKDSEHLLFFSREYDGHKFVDKAGNESYAVVEFAPYQKVPGEKKKPDSRNATIEKGQALRVRYAMFSISNAHLDEDYISFVESLNVQSNAEPVTIETLVASTRPASPPKTTPLLEALKAERQAQKDKEAIIRNHPHYKDLMNAPNPHALRKEEKRKIARAEVPPPSVGKKPKKGAPSPAPSKQIQIQTKPNASGSLTGKPNLVPPTKPSGRPGRVRHASKGPTEATPVPPTAPVPSTSPKDTTPVANSPHQIPPSVPTSTAPPRRGRPVLGLGSRHFEAALNGVGVNGERKRKEKGKEPATATAFAQEPNAQDKPVPAPVSPRRSRHRKEGPSGNAASPSVIPDANGSSTLTMQQGEGPSVPNIFNVGRGGRRGGRGGRGRGGPPRGG
ncbi:hypothetical protein AGABI2DRAFT_187731 [Agaricus bisporus var. bisporus H97]|uniref:hypothetical protein n=1 Tax=Agaricus bisporus var. bisporus (strain H97 / ATCC MYA-4626 / FGSC 10389) TaxID=936046 RepID=UPI00029F5CA1|nr:hypothetical protein AGABI2DRAFT_187731 [Agaricus bisporus var. bisporus H97]EKV44059.1 hypothetical protein AGABI2DRAFT_187731 [Agaricus bisporus var. bisporus H97]